MEILHFLHYAVLYILLQADSNKAYQSRTDLEPELSNRVDLFSDNSKSENKYPYIGSFMYHIREDTLPELCSEVAMGNIPCPTSNCSITLNDIAEATEIEKFNQLELLTALGKLNVSLDDFYKTLLLYDIKPESIESLLQTFDLTFSDLYQPMVEKFENPKKTIPDILRILNVTVDDFMNAQAYGNDTMRLRVLATGNYSTSNLESVLKLTNKTGLDMMNILPLSAIAKKLGRVDGNNFANLVKNMGITTPMLLELYKYLNITPIHFLSHSPFIQLVTDYYDYLNPQDVLGVIIDKNIVLTSNKATVLTTFVNQNSRLVRDFSTFLIELVEDPMIQYAVRSVSWPNIEYQSKDIAKVIIQDFVMSSYPKTSNTTHLKNCSYISKIPYGGVYSENISNAVMEKSNIVIMKSNKTAFALGSSLFCQNALQGIAMADDGKRIIFSTALRNPGVVPPPITNTTTNSTVILPQKPSGGVNNSTGLKPNSGSNIREISFCLLLMVVCETILNLWL